MKKLAITLLSMFLVSCMATGPAFNSLQPEQSDLVSLYILRQSAFAASAYCPPVTIDGEKIGCLKNGGYIRKYVSPGLHEVRFEKRFGEMGKEHFIKINGKPGETLFFEWAYDVDGVWSTGFVSGATFSEAIVQHKQEQAIEILRNLNES